MISTNKSFNLQKFADEQKKNLRYFEDVTDEEIKDFVKKELFYLSFLDSIEEAESIYKSEDGEDIDISVDDTPAYCDRCLLPCRDERMLIPVQDGKFEEGDIFKSISVEVYGVGMLGCSNDFYIIKIVRQ